MEETVTLREYLKVLNARGEDIDVYVDGLDGIAVCPPIQKLTEVGYAHFAPCLDLPVEGDTIMGTDEDYDELYDYIEEDKGDGGRMELAYEYIRAMAGYCAASDYKKWFVAEE